MNLASPFTLESSRLLLRNLKESDWDDFFHYRSDPRTAQYQLWEPYDRQRSLEYILEYKESRPAVPGQWHQLGIVLKRDNRLIGDCAIKQHVVEPRIAEIGCSLSPHYQHQGYACEAMTLLLDYYFSEAGLNRVTGIADSENRASIRLMERLGMRKEGHFIQSIWFKGKWGDECSYALLKNEWLRHREKDILPGMRRTGDPTG